MTRKYGVWGAAAVLTVSLAACAPGSGDGGDAVNLKVWGWRQEDVAAYNKIFQIYEDANPGVTVEYVPYKNTEYDTILKTGLTDANGPDVAQLRSYGLLQPLVAAGGLVPLDDVKELGGFPEPVLDGARGESDEKVYGVPFALQTLHVIYNQKLFADHGITAPTTWADMVAAFDKLNSAKVIPLASTVTDTWMLPIQHEIFGATTYGGPDYLDKMLTGGSKFTDAPWVKSLETWKGTDKYWAPQSSGMSYADAQALFTAGRAAMFPGGIWELAVFQKANPDLKMGIFNVPPAPGAPVDKTLVPGYVDGSFGVSAKSAKREAALDLVRWMASEEFGRAYSGELRQISAVPGVQPQDELLAQALKAYQENPSPYVTYAYFSGGSPTAWDLASAAFSDYLLGRRTAADAAGHIQRGVDQWFRPRN
ncbi:extracellular solute-binding protein [Micromonospora sp. NBRC 101691]|uniref:ABC transporter substrate-binding protein n=1 Tax=Micromonospora sp. NBRC 101691 TaxID=3032198 RepID=UPI002554A746|nr:extracellular solute-binding protein [Micromonospora sp. NBRC 101691]